MKFDYVIFHQTLQQVSEYFSPLFSIIYSVFIFLVSYIQLIV